MSPDLTAATHYFTIADFKTLFNEELGWDRFKEVLSVTVDQEIITLSGIAHKRGAQVYVCKCGSDGFIPHATTRRFIQYAVRQVAHHNLVVFLDASHSISIWQWAEWYGNEQTPRIYEHTATASSAAELLERLSSIAFTLEEEEAISILDVAIRLKNAFCDHQHRLLRGRHRRLGLRAYDLTEMDGSVRFWWERVLSEPHLTREQEFKAACAMCQGDAKACELLIKSHLHLVARIAWKIATKYECSLDDYLDLVQTGNVELVRITPGFNPAEGIRFQTYVTYRVKKVLLRSLSGEEGFIPVPRYLLESLPNVGQQHRLVEDALMQHHKRPICENEIIECLATQYGAEVQAVSQVLAALEGLLSLDDVDQEEDFDSPALDSHGLLASFVTRDTINQILSILKPRQREVIQRRFGLSPFNEQTLEEIAVAYGLTRERVRQVELMAMKKLKKSCSPQFFN